MTTTGGQNEFSSKFHWSQHLDMYCRVIDIYINLIFIEHHRQTHKLLNYRVDAFDVLNLLKSLYAAREGGGGILDISRDLRG